MGNQRWREGIQPDLGEFFGGMRCALGAGVLVAPVRYGVSGDGFRST